MVEDAHAAPLLPSPATVATEDYPLSRRLYLYAPAERAGGRSAASSTLPSPTKGKTS